MFLRKRRHIIVINKRLVVGSFNVGFGLGGLWFAAHNVRIVNLLGGLSHLGIEDD
jgi:hypothetical protein